MVVDKYIADQINLMRKYKDGRDVDPGDRPYIDELCSIGMMKTGVSLKRQVITAKPIGLGLKIMEGFGDQVPYVEPHHPVIEEPKTHVTYQTLTIVKKDGEDVVRIKQHSVEERFEGIE